MEMRLLTLRLFLNWTNDIECVCSVLICKYEIFQYFIEEKKCKYEGHWT